MAQETCGSVTTEINCVNGEGEISTTGEGRVAVNFKPGDSFEDENGEEIYKNTSGEIKKKYIRSI